MKLFENIYLNIESYRLFFKSYECTTAPRVILVTVKNISTIINTKVN